MFTPCRLTTTKSLLNCFGKVRVVVSSSQLYHNTKHIMANKSKRKAPAATSQSKWTSLPWQSVQVGKDTADITDDVDDKVWLSNHYDNPKLRRSDLYEGDSKGLDFVEGANDPGIFLGLEVIDGSQYEVEKVPISSGEEGAETKGFISRLVIKDAFAEFVAEETGRGKSGSQSKALRGKSGSEAKAAAKSKIAKDRESSSTEPAEENTLSRKEKNQLKLEKLKAKRKEIKLKKKRKREEAESEVAATGKIESATTTSSKKKRKSENKISKPGTLAVTEDQMKSIQIPWSIATGGVYLHPKLCKALFRLNFSTPTPIQSSTLAASILGLRDVVGAAPTGSGKTLSYLLPILHHLLTEEDERRKQEDHSTDESFSYPLTALILCPTRELAMQVSTEFSKLVYDIEQDRTSESRSLIQCGTIVGGLSEQKQKRVLDVKRPPVLVGTPGRLWDLVSERTIYDP
jgi:ATP-dependent RNA helicase DDX24/MAK5